MLFAGLFLLMMLRYSFSILIPRILLTALVAVMAMIGGKNENVAVLMSLIPLHNAVDFYIALMLCIAVFAVKYYSDMRIGNFVVLAGIMIAWELLHCYFFAWTPTMLLASIMPIVCIAVFMSFDIGDVDYSFIVRTMSVVSIYMCLLFLMNIIVNSGFNLSEAFANARRLGLMSDEEMLIGGAINPNALGIVNVLCMTTLMQLRIVGDKKKSDMVLLVLLMLFGILTLSRTFLVCLLAMFAFLVFGQEDLRKSLRIVGGGIIIAFVVIAIIAILFPEVIISFVERFLEEDITTGRVDIMKDYDKFIFSDIKILFFGIGATDLSEKAVNKFSISSYVPHNSIQEVLVAWGIPGLVMLTAFVVMIIFEAKKRRNKNSLLNYAPMAIILLKSMAGQLLTSGYTMIALTLAYLSLCQDFRRK